MPQDKVKYAIVENERFALEYLQLHIGKLRPSWELVFTAGSVEECIEYFMGRSNTEVQVCFMDIELDDGNCFDFFSQVRFCIPVIFTTAYDDFMLQAFDVNSIGYLLKPVERGALIKVIEKYEKWINEFMKSDSDKVLRNEPATSHGRVLTVNGDSYHFTAESDIAWFVSEDKYVFLITVDGRKHLTAYKNLNDVESTADSVRFFRLSRNIIASVECISGVYKYFKGRLRISLSAGKQSEEAIVSAVRRREFLGWLGSGSE